MLFLLLLPAEGFLIGCKISEMSKSTRSVSPAGPQQILTIDWKLLWRRVKLRISQYFSAARHRAAQTEYIPPKWMIKLRLTWFRFGLIALAIFVFTQKQVDFTISVGKEGIATNSRKPSMSKTTVGNTAALGVLTASDSEADEWTVDKYDAATVKAYVNRFKRVAQTEEDKYSIPLPAKLAMAILASDAGKSGAARNSNNHFGTPLSGGYYDNAWSNWRAHSELIDREYPQLADESVNHQQWIAALTKTNYTSDQHYETKLLAIIKRFQLDRI